MGTKPEKQRPCLAIQPTEFGGGAAQHGGVAVDDELFRRDLGPLPEALQEEVRRALLEFLDLL